MTERLADISQQRAARIAGAGYLVIIAAGVVAEFVIRASLIVPGDAAATVGSIAASHGLFRLSIAADLVMLTADVVVALALYTVLRPVNRSLALLAAFFRLAHAAVYGANLLTLATVLMLVSGAPWLAALGARELGALVQLFLSAHGYGYDIGLVFFGVHCLVLGWLLLRSGYVPAVLGPLMGLAGLGYLADSFASFLVAGYDATPVFLAVPIGIAELSLCLWLLTKGVTVEETR